MVLFEKDEIKKYRKRGVVIGSGCKFYNANIDYGHGFLVKIGNNVTLSHCSILTHDASTERLIGYTKIGKVTIEDNVFVGMNSIILPNVNIGENSIIGAGTVITKSIPSNVVVAGNPAKVICDIDTFKNKYLKLLNNSPKYDKVWTEMSSEDKDRIIKEVYSIGFVK